MSYVGYGSSILANLSPAAVHGWPNGLGLHRVRFSVNYATIARKEQYFARNFRALVTVSRTHQDGAHIGTAWPESAWFIRTGPHTDQQGILFDLDITSEQVALIEDLRAGGDLVFKLKFLYECQGDAGPQGGSAEIQYNVNKSAWIACMKQFGLDRIVLLEIRLPAEHGALATAANLLAKARAELDAGNFDGVVQKCRLAIESAQKTLELQPRIQAAIAAFGRDKTRMSKQDRALVVHEAARHYAHLAHHVDDDGRTFDYGRQDAAFMLALASAVVSNAPGISKTSPTAGA
jgi:hypothetical protein